MIPRPDGTPRFELWLYLFAAVTYIAMGFVAKEVFAWWSYGAIWLIAVVWLGPEVLRRVRGQSRGASGPTSKAENTSTATGSRRPDGDE